MRRDDFLERVRRALGRAADAPLAAPPPPPAAALVSPSTSELPTEELASAFALRAQAIGAAVHPASAGEAAEVAATLARALGASVCADGDEAAGEAARASGLPLAPPDEADVGITGAWRGVAETGTVVLRAEPGRLEGLLPPAHIVLLREEDVRRGLVDTYADLEGALPSGLVQITGPSRTADIEMSLTTGVHGPGTLVIVLIGA